MQARNNIDPQGENQRRKKGKEGEKKGGGREKEEEEKRGKKRGEKKEEGRREKRKEKGEEKGEEREEEGERRYAGSAYFDTLTKIFNLRHAAETESSLDRFQIQLFAVLQTLLTHNELHRK